MNSTARVIVLVIALLATAAAIGIFTRGATAIWRTVRRGQPSPGRLTPVGQRLGAMLGEILSHRRFAGSLPVRIAHWFVMLSFPILVLTLVASYGQIVDPTFALPVIGHWAPYEWVTEFFAWGGLIGIVGLMIRRLVVRPTRAAARRGQSAAQATTDAAEPADRTTAGTQPADATPAESRIAGTDSADDGAPDPVTTPGSPARASRFFGSNAAQAYFVEWTVLAVIVCVLALRGLECALAAQQPATAALATAWHFPLTSWFGLSWVPVARGTLAAVVAVIAAVKIAISLTWFVVVGLTPAMGVAWHRFLAILNSYARRNPGGGPALGPLAPLAIEGKPVDFEQIDELPEDATFGAGAAQDLPWKALLDAATCTECGRCQTACPAWLTGKPLNPKLLMMGLRDEAAAGHWDTPLVGSAISEDALWACTMCGACVQECPVDIEHVDAIGQLRRHQVLMDSAFPPELASTYRKLETQGNPFGAPARGRMDWAKGLAFPVPVIGRDVTDTTEVDYVMWVGCAGSFDTKAQATTRALAELLHIAGVQFAVLGQAESCTGDPARRTGNEMLFQLLAAALIETLNDAKVTRIVTSCAHCFNAFATEYPQLGGTYEVLHHSQLLNALVRDGQLTPVPRANGPRVTYHDPCFLGRHNQVYAPPREVLAAAGAQVTEMPRHSERALCCGAGGGRAWLEEPIGTRISTERGREAVATGADVVATACPYCTIMLSDGVAAAGEDRADGGAAAGAPAVRDLAVVLLDSVRGDPA